MFRFSKVFSKSSLFVFCLFIAASSGFLVTTPSIAFAQTLTQTQQGASALTTSGINLLHASVNIVCLSSDPSIPSVSGSGVIIDSRGIILTAAHVAQLFLLQNYLGTSKVQCLVRSGSPARRAYTAEPIYVSSSWIASNLGTLSAQSPTGTGQYDVALLGITGTATSTPLPQTFPYIPLSNDERSASEPISIVSYGAEYLSANAINHDLYPILVFGNIANRYTFGSGDVDLFSVNGSAASQEGSSGGGISNALGQLVGIITTSSVTGPFADRVLNAVSTTHLRSTYQKDTGNDLDTVLQSNTVPQLIANFSETSEILGSQLYSHLHGF